MAGRAADPALAGSALHLLAMDDEALLPGGLVRLAAALAMRATEAGAELRCGMAAAEIRRGNHGVSALVLADGTEIAARAVLSTLDLRQTFLSFFNWAELPPDLVARVGQFRMGGGTARILFALDAPPDLAPFVLRSPIDIAPSADAIAEAYAAFRAGIIPEHPPLRLRFVSSCDPGLAPQGKAVMTATLGGIPHRLFDGAWTHEKREALRQRALAAVSCVLPGLGERVLAAQVIAPPDIEEALGCTEGDLLGGEIASDQMLGMRPWLDRAAPRTAIAGLYLAGSSTAAGVSATCASGAFAARAIIADLAAGRLR
jgi:phytoene dehydrogenase-like protein